MLRPPPRSPLSHTLFPYATLVRSFTAQIWALLDMKSASLGTLGLHGTGLDDSVAHTTPDPVRLHELLARAKRAGIEHLALEASSHGLDQHRLDGVARSEEHTSELQSLMRISYAVFCLKKKNK